MDAVLPFRSLRDILLCKVGLESSFARKLDGKIVDIVLEDS
jgi:hypothetical protein